MTERQPPTAAEPLSVEAREALEAWGPPTPEHDNPLYYPLQEEPRE